MLVGHVRFNVQQHTSDKRRAKAARLFIFIYTMVETITPSRIREYFNLVPTSFGLVKPEMLLSFSYRSPDRKIHDPDPLIYVLEKRSDRIYGLNLHYHFALIGGLIMLKRRELEQETTYQDVNVVEKADRSGKKQLNEDVPDVVGRDPNKPNPNVVGSGGREPNPNVVGGGVKGRDPNVVGRGKEPEPPAPTKPAARKPKKIIQRRLLETYELETQPKEILRNYLLRRMSNVKKLIFKV